jgi:hypothetical protein
MTHVPDGIWVVTARHVPIVGDYRRARRDSRPARAAISITIVDFVLRKLPRMRLLR